MSDNDFAARMRSARSETREPAEKRAEETFTPAAPRKEPSHKTTVNLPLSLYEQARREAFDTGVSMTDQLIIAWKRERGLM